MSAGLNLGFDPSTRTRRGGGLAAEIIGVPADGGKVAMEGGERPHIAVAVSSKTLRTGSGRPLWGIVPIVPGTKSEPIDIGTGAGRRPGP